MLGLVAVIKQVMTGVGVTEEELEALRKQGSKKKAREWFKLSCIFRSAAGASPLKRTGPLTDMIGRLEYLWSSWCTRADTDVSTDMLN